MTDMQITGDLLLRTIESWGEASPYTKAEIPTNAHDASAGMAMWDAIVQSLKVHCAHAGIIGIGIALAFRQAEEVFDQDKGEIVEKDFMDVTIHHEGLTTTICLEMGEVA